MIEDEDDYDEVNCDCDYCLGIDDDEVDDNYFSEDDGDYGCDCDECLGINDE